MKKTLFILSFSVIICISCNNVNSSKQRIDLKEQELKQKEQALIDEQRTALERERLELEKEKDKVQQKKNNTVTAPKVYNAVNQGIYPETSLRKLNYNDINSLSNYDLKIMRNEIFARHGYIFKTDDMRQYFNSQNWYSPMYNEVSSSLSSIEKYNVEFIKKYE